jgi:GTP-binding protein
VDKLSNNQAIARSRAIERELRVSTGKRPILFSAKTEKGKSEIWQALDDHLRLLESVNNTNP